MGRSTCVTAAADARLPKTATSEGINEHHDAGHQQRGMQQEIATWISMMKKKKDRRRQRAHAVRHRPSPGREQRPCRCRAAGDNGNDPLGAVAARYGLRNLPGFRRPVRAGDVRTSSSAQWQRGHRADRQLSAARVHERHARVTSMRSPCSGTSRRAQTVKCWRGRRTGRIGADPRKAEPLERHGRTGPRDEASHPGRSGWGARHV